MAACTRAGGDCLADAFVPTRTVVGHDWIAGWRLFRRFVSVAIGKTENAGDAAGVPGGR